MTQQRPVNWGDGRNVGNVVNHCQSVSCDKVAPTGPEAFFGEAYFWGCKHSTKYLMNVPWPSVTKMIPTCPIFCTLPCLYLFAWYAWRLSFKRGDVTVMCLQSCAYFHSGQYLVACLGECKSRRPCRHFGDSGGCHYNPLYTLIRDSISGEVMLAI